jgi:hypothetical protein
MALAIMLLKVYVFNSAIMFGNISKIKMLVLLANFVKEVLSAIMFEINGSWKILSLVIGIWALYLDTHTLEKVRKTNE